VAKEARLKQAAEDALKKIAEDARQAKEDKDAAATLGVAQEVETERLQALADEEETNRLTDTKKKKEEEEAAVETARVAAEETARVVAAEPAAGATPENTDTNIDLLQLTDVELNEICTRKSLSAPGNTQASYKIKLILENGDAKDSEYIAKKYNMIETDRAKCIQQLLKLRYTIDEMKNWKTKAFEDFAIAHNLHLPKADKTLPLVANELQLKTPSCTSKTKQATLATKYQIDGGENTKTLLQNVKTLLEVPLTRYMPAWGG
jgi:hypothetical protein